MNECKDCFRCCSGSIPLSEQDLRLLPLDKIQDLEIASLDFIKRYQHLLEEPIAYVLDTDHYCNFLINGSCSVYDTRPEICRRYPNYPNLSPWTKNNCNLLKN